MDIAYNSRTITLKLDSVSRHNGWAETMAYSESDTRLKAHTHFAVLVSANPIRNDYDLSQEDFDFIAKKRAEVEAIMAEVSAMLKSKEK